MCEKTPEHGGDVYNLARSLGVRVDDLLDFSANINPLGFPPAVLKASSQALKEICHYPDRQCLDLRKDLAAYHHLSPEEILVGNGSTELIYLIARALRPAKALIVAPAFSEYEQALKAAQIPRDFYITTEAHHFTLDKTPALGGADLVFLANPASPSGALLPPDRLLPLMAALGAAGVRILLDEAFIDFVEEASLKTYLREFPHLLILRSFTKFFGIPGLRLGYLLAAPQVITHLGGAQEPWSVNTMAQVMGRAGLADQDFIARTRTLIHREREYLRARLAALDGCQPFPGAVNYLLVKLTRPGWTAAKLRQGLLKHHLLIRDAGNFNGLDERFFRIAVRTRKENNRLLQALKNCFKAG